MTEAAGGRDTRDPEGRPVTSPDSHPRVRRLPLLPAGAFVLVWSSGYVAGLIGVRAVQPFTLVAVRFALAAVVLALIARVASGPFRLGRHDWPRVVVVGVVVNAVQFGCYYVGFTLGAPATLSAMLTALSPVLTVVLGFLALHEQVRRVQVVGLVVGIGGVVLVLGPDVQAAGGALGIAFIAAGTIALSLGTLGQRWISPRADPLWSATVQFAVAVAPSAVLALALEGLHGVSDPTTGAVAVAWLALVNSVGGLLLLGLLVRTGGAGAASSVFFLIPPVTAVLAWLFLDEVLRAYQLAGMLVATVGVALATRSTGPGPAVRRSAEG